MNKVKSNGNGHAVASPQAKFNGDTMETLVFDDAADAAAYENLLRQQQDGPGGIELAPIPGLVLPRIKALKNGCYMAYFHPVTLSPLPVLLTSYYIGTIRIEKTTSYTKASGDLYYKKNLPVLSSGGIFAANTNPSPGDGVPVFPIVNYTYYLKVTKVLQGFCFGSFDLEFEMYKYDKATRSFPAPKPYKKAIATMSWTTAPAGYPDAGQYLKGTVKEQGTGIVLGNLTMGWVDSYYRKATIEVDRVSGSENPDSNGAGENWATIGNKIGWKITQVNSSTSVPPPSGDGWSDAEMHQRMLAYRDTSDLDKEWRYHVLCVKLIDSTPRGIMYDNGGTDSNNVPREGIGISSHWVIPNTNAWGLVKGMRFGTAKAPYFRTVVHEIGHAMGLYHNTVDNGFMNTTDVIAASATSTTPFPNNIKWNYASDDQNRLRHFPDIVVRPGGTAFGISYGSVPVSDEAADATTIMDEAGIFDEYVALEVKPTIDVFPIGAPVRLDFSIKNVGVMALEIPQDLSMKKAEVFGNVIDPSGNIRSFSPIMRCVDTETTMMLQPGQKAGDSLTLLRGKDGALFQQPGYHVVEVFVKWDVAGNHIVVKGKASVMISAPANDAHAKVAKAIFDTPDTHLVLVMGGDHLTDAVQVIQDALANEVLKPHYAYIEAKRVGKGFGKRRAQKDKAKSLLQKNVVLNQKEKQKAKDLAN